MAQETDLCPICRKYFKSSQCKHSTRDVDAFLDRQRVRKIAKDAIGELNLDQFIEKLTDRLAMIEGQLQTLLAARKAAPDVVKLLDRVIEQLKTDLDSMEKIDIIKELTELKDTLS